MDNPNFSGEIEDENNADTIPVSINAKQQLRLKSAGSFFCARIN
jgi:hypothetical protein